MLRWATARSCRTVVPSRVSVRVKKLQALALSWGGQVIGLSKLEFEEAELKESYSEAPFSANNLGVIWEEKKIVFSGDVHWYELVHEMGHVFASRVCPYEADEVSFFGWEYALAKQLRGVSEWKEQNKDYAIAPTLPSEKTGPGESWEEFGMYTNGRQMEIIRERVKYAKSVGLLDDALQPMAIR